jgi:cytoskeletal protein CcmA (bactofilin family)
MLSKWTKDKDVNTGSLKKESPKDISEHTVNMKADENTDKRKTNNIIKGSKVTGDISVSCDLVVSGNVVGNITALEDSNVVIKGSCKGNIETRRGDAGKFTGGEVKAGGKIYVNCEFTGRLEGNEIEIGAHAHIRGELFYKEFITISRGAKVEVHLSRIEKESKGENKTPKNKVVEMKPPVKELSGVK